MDPVTEIILYFAIDHYFNFINHLQKMILKNYDLDLISKNN